MRLVLFSIALLLRIAAIEWTGAEVVRFGDAPDYLAAATAICAEGSYPARGSLPFFRAPGLPLFIAAVTACDTSRTRAVKYGLAAADAFTAVLVLLIAQGLWLRFGEGRFGAAPFFGDLLVAFHPLMIAGVTDIRSEPLFMMLLAASLAALLHQRPAAAGCLIALAALTRPTALLCIPLFAAFLWTFGEGRRRKMLPLLFLLAAATTLSPWVIRNAVRFGELIIVNDAGGFNLWRGNHPELLATVRTGEPAAFQARSRNFELVTVPRAAEIVESRARTPGERNREWRRLALENIRRDPPAALFATGWKALMFWRPWLHPAEHGAAAMALSLMVSLTLFIGAVAGLAQLPDRRWILAIAIFAGAVWLAHLPYIPTIRLRMSMLDPLLMGLTAGALSAVTVRFRHDWRGLLPLLAVFVPIVAVTVLATQFEGSAAAEAVIGAIRGAAASWWAIPLFLVLYVVFAVFLLPVGLLSATAALAWGWKVGGTIELITCTIAAAGPYLLARRGLSSWFERRVSRQSLPALESPFVLFILRIVPIVPYVALNYLAGIMRIRPRPYLLATFAGSIPSIFLFAYFVDTMAQGALGVATQARIVAACVAIAAAAIILRILGRRLSRRWKLTGGRDA